MRSIIAYLPILPDSDSTAKFESLFAIQAARVHSTEPGCLLYQLCKNRKKPGQYTVVEIYEDQAAIDLHVVNLKKYHDPEQAKLFTGKPDVHVFDVVGNHGLKDGIAKRAIVATMTIKQGSGDGFEKAALPVMEKVHSNEPGNLCYCLSHSEDKRTYVFIELYTDKKSDTGSWENKIFSSWFHETETLYRKNPIVFLTSSR